VSSEPPIAAEALIHAGQRRVNLIWEITQALIALFVTGSFALDNIINTDANSSSGLSAAFFIIIGFYFARTNHASIGGIGPKPQQEYQGR
jgi:heme/copper-type cytochrome/quinol oxidase subunit 3